MKFLMIATVTVLSVMGTAYAQTNTGTGTATADSQTSSQAGSTANPTINQNFGGTPSTQNINNVPALQLPSVIGGNPCGIGGSAGFSMMGVGVGGGLMVEGESCETRQKVALYHNIGMARLNAGDRTDSDGWFRVAKEVACADRETRKNFAAIGVPCIADRPQAAQAPAPAMNVPSVPVAPVKAFNPREYSSSGDCHSAAYANGVDMAICKQVWRETVAAVGANVIAR